MSVVGRQNFRGAAGGHLYVLASTNKVNIVLLAVRCINKLSV